MINNELYKEDFNLEKKYELFEVIYAISEKPTENKIESYVVIGHVLNSNSDRRCFEYEICSYPISVFVKENIKCLLRDIERGRIISRNKYEIIEKKKIILAKFLDEQLNELK